MSWRDALALAARGISRQFGRAILTVLAVALAAALLTALAIIANTAQSRVIGQLTKGGPLATIRVEGSRLGPHDVARLKALPDVHKVLPVAVVQEVVIPPNPPTYQAGPSRAASSTSAAPGYGPFLEGVVGIDMGHADAFPLTVLAGRLPSGGTATEVAVTADYLGRVGLDRNDPVPVLGTEVELGAPRFLGTDIRQGVWARWTRAIVVGVVAQEAGSGEILAPLEQVVDAQRFEQLSGGEPLPFPSTAFSGGSASGTVINPLTSNGLSQAAAAFGPSNGSVEGDGQVRYTALLAEATSLDRVGQALDEINSLGYFTSAPETLIATVQRYLHVVQIVLSAIGLIALVVAALGIANALFAAIRERRREIGVLKAIGARDRDVRRIFLVEASLVGILGGVVGAFAGLAVARTVAAIVSNYLVTQGLLGVKLVAPVRILAQTVAGSIVLALLAGAWPATRAARMPAREAMGDE